MKQYLNLQKKKKKGKEKKKQLGNINISFIDYGACTDIRALAYTLIHLLLLVYPKMVTKIIF